MNSHVVSIAGTEVQQVLYKGEPVVTFAMVDEVHKRPEGTAKRTFSENRERFVDGEDVVLVPASQRDEFRTFGIEVPNRGLTLITRRGYLKLVKPLTDDRAWEVQGEMIDRYFAVEKLAATLPAEVLEEIRRTDGISRMLAHKVTEQGKDIAALVQTVTALAGIVKPGVPGVYRPGKTAGAILRAAGFTNCPTRLALWFGNRLEAAGCRVEGKIDTGTGRARLFDPDKAETYLKNGGAAAVEKKMAERRGQGILPFGARLLRQHLPAMQEGQGAVIFGGKLVMFDTSDISIAPGEHAVILKSNGELGVEPVSEGGECGRTFGPRARMTLPTDEGGGKLQRAVQHLAGVIGKVIEIREIRPRPVLVSSCEA